MRIFAFNVVSHLLELSVHRLEAEAGSGVGSSIVASLRGAYRNWITSGSLASTLKDSAVKNCDTLFVTTCLSCSRATGSKLWVHVAGSGQITFLRPRRTDSDGKLLHYGASRKGKTKAISLRRRSGTSGLTWGCGNLAAIWDRWLVGKASARRRTSMDYRRYLEPCPIFLSPTMRPFLT